MIILILTVHCTTMHIIYHQYGFQSRIYIYRQCLLVVIEKKVSKDCHISTFLIRVIIIHRPTLLKRRVRIAYHNIPRRFKESGRLGRFVNITAIFLLLLLFRYELSLQTHLKQIFSFGFKILSNKIQPIRLKWRKKSSNISHS